MTLTYASAGSFTCGLCRMLECRELGISETLGGAFFE
jgi:hypothetical protein